MPISANSFSILVPGILKVKNYEGMEKGKLVLNFAKIVRKNGGKIKEIREKRSRFEEKGT